MRSQVISPEGAAASSGRIAVGDVIVAIDGQFIIGFTHEDIVSRLRRASSVRLTLVKVGALCPDVRCALASPS